MIKLTKKTLLITLLSLPYLALTSHGNEAKENRYAQCYGVDKNGSKIEIDLYENPGLPEGKLSDTPPAMAAYIKIDGKPSTFMINGDTYSKMYLANRGVKTYEEASILERAFHSTFPTERQNDPTRILIYKNLTSPNLKTRKAQVVLPHRDFYQWNSWEQRCMDSSLWRVYINVTCVLNPDL